MADLSIDFAGIKSPNPFWLASAPPANTGEQVMRAFDAGWGGAVWKTLGDPIVNVTSRFGAIDYGGGKVMGFNNIELITDRPLEVNLAEIREVKRRYPKHAVVVSLMTETKDDWQTLIRKVEDTGCDGLELNFGCPHGMCERGMGSSVGQEPKLITGDHALGEGVREDARPREAHARTPATSSRPGRPRGRGGADGVSLINTIKSLIGVDLERHGPLPARRRRVDQRRLLRPGGEAHRAPHGGGARARQCESASPSRASAASRTGATRPSSSRSARRACRCARR